MFKTQYMFRILTFLNLVGVGSILMFCSVRGVTEGLLATYEFAQVRLLARVTPHVRLEVLQATVSLRAFGILKARKMSHHFNSTFSKSFRHTTKHSRTTTSDERPTMHLCGFSPVCLLM